MVGDKAEVAPPRLGKLLDTLDDLRHLIRQFPRQTQWVFVAEMVKVTTFRPCTT
ncbi:MAG: hypothetical protein IPK44_25490 [Candidatus Accumulibacter sp.]|uniref:hypothetical protein n=1 Tax=Accumulibacter sp. TaxID=2053492 RepID=UPI0025850419|nr:hypothetical protein [Accumulibacter sp.]MBK8117643.1 hypothetical protein [Accumulibacter sp.]